MDFLVSLAIGLGLIFSAETLTLLGNGIGLGGIWFFLCVFAAVGIHLFRAAKLYGNMARQQDEYLLIQHSFSRTIALMFPLSARLVVTITISTSLMATAGFVFNEVFFYWFPNYLFAFLFLGIIFIINVSSRNVWGKFQVFFITLVLMGLVILIIAGIGASPESLYLKFQVSKPVEWERIVLYAFLIPIGYDLAFYGSSDNFQAGKGSPAAAVVFGGLILIIWGIISLNWVSQDKLANSTIPHIITARSILGQNGRLIIGIVVIAGAGGAVNALFGSVSKMLNNLSADGLVPAAFGEQRFNGRLPVILLAVTTFAMLIFGMAGSSYLKVFLRSGLILWLFYYAVLHLAALRSDKTGITLSTKRIIHGFGGLIFLLAGSGLIIIDDNTRTIAIFIVCVVSTVLILEALTNGLSFKWGKQADKK